MMALIIGAGALLLGFAMMVTGIRLGQRMQKESCGCDVNPFANESECSCGGNCSCNS